MCTTSTKDDMTVTNVVSFSVMFFFLFPLSWLMPEALAYAQAAGINLELDLTYYNSGKELDAAWTPSFGPDDVSLVYPLYNYWCYILAKVDISVLCHVDVSQVVCSMYNLYMSYISKAQTASIICFQSSPKWLGPNPTISNATSQLRLCVHESWQGRQGRGFEADASRALRGMFFCFRFFYYTNNFFAVFTCRHYHYITT